MSDLDALRERLVAPNHNAAPDDKGDFEDGVDAALAALEQVGWTNNWNRHVWDLSKHDSLYEGDDNYSPVYRITPDTEGEGR